MQSEPRHQCLIYKGSPSQQLPALAAIIKNKLAEGFRCLYLNSTPMVAGLSSTLASIGVDIAQETTKKSLVLSSDPLTPEGNFDSKVMLNSLEEALNEALKDGFKGLWASGDMTWEFGPERDFSKLLEYELGLEELFSRRKELFGICQYHQDTLPKEAMRKSLLVHPKIVVSETLSFVNPHYLKSTVLDLNTNDKLDSMITALCAM